MEGRPMQVTNEDYAFLLEHLATDEETGEFRPHMLSDEQNAWLEDYRHGKLGPKTCAGCGSESKPYAHYCHRCGAKLD